MKRVGLVLSGMVGLGFACMGGEEEKATEEETPSVEMEPGKLPVEFPTMGTKAEIDSFVLVPSESFLQKAWDEGMDKATFIYYGATMIEPGETQSKVKSLAGTEFSMPNSLIIDIGPSDKVSAGAIMLGHWESGSGLKRAIAISSGDAPKVRYVDDAYDKDDDGYLTQEDQWEAGRYSILTDVWQVGTSLVCGEEHNAGVLVAKEGKDLLSLGFAGRVTAYTEDDCVSLPPWQDLEVGAKVFVPVIGTYREGTVKELETSIGRAWVEYEFGGKAELQGFGIPDVALSITEQVEGTAAPVQEEEAATPESSDPAAKRNYNKRPPYRGEKKTIDQVRKPGQGRPTHK